MYWCPYDSYHVTVWVGSGMDWIGLCVKVAGPSEKNWMFQWIPEWSKADSAAKKQTIISVYRIECIDVIYRSRKKKIVCQVEKIKLFFSQYF